MSAGHGKAHGGEQVGAEATLRKEADVKREARGLEKTFANLEVLLGTSPDVFNEAYICHSNREPASSLLLDGVRSTSGCTDTPAGGLSSLIFPRKKEKERERARARV